MKSTTIYFKGIDFFISYFFQPTERDNNIQEHVEIDEIKYNGECFMDIMRPYILELEGIVFDAEKDNNEGMGKTS